MRVKSLITSFIFLACLNYSIAQKVRKKNKLLIYSPLREFFQQNPSLREVEIVDWRPGANGMKVVTIADSALKTEYYNLGFEGDKYQFEKKFGKWSFPDSLVLALIDKKADAHQVSCHVRHDSIFTRTELIYYPKGQLVWERVKDTIGYIKGMYSLEKELQAGIQHISPNEKLTDSVFLFQAILSTDSTLKVARQITSENEIYANAFTTILDRSYPWQPLIHGGIRLKYSARIYIKINNDGSVSAAVKQP